MKQKKGADLLLAGILMGLGILLLFLAAVKWLNKPQPIVMSESSTVSLPAADPVIESSSTSQAPQQLVGEPGDEEASLPQRGMPEEEDSTTVHLNSASQQELETLPGIGPVLAQRILDARRERGGFQRLEELMEVQGIGEKTFAKIEPYLSLD